jgi:hypothetical protein
LQVLNEELDAGLVLCKGLFPTRSHVSMARNRFAPYWGSQHYVIWKLNELHHYGWDFVKSRCVPPAPYEGRKKIYRKPVNTEMMQWLGVPFITKNVGRLVKSRSDEVQDWSFGTRVIPSADEALTCNAGNVGGFQWITPADNRFYADPFLLTHGGKPWLFYEEFDYVAGRAHIAGVGLNPQTGKPDGEAFPALKPDYHLSYPMVFSHDGEVFMIPESRATNRVELYRAVNFPYEWKLEKVLWSGLELVDTTALFHDGRWYFFTSAEFPSGHANTLLLFSADSLTGEWKLHPSSPISTDVRTSRSGGAILRDGGRLIRPTQDCRSCYGYAIHLHEITALDESVYTQRQICDFNPASFGREGVHTYGRTGNIEVIDGFRRMKRTNVRQRPRQHPPVLRRT